MCFYAKSNEQSKTHKLRVIYEDTLIDERCSKCEKSSFTLKNLHFRSSKALQEQTNTLLMCFFM